MEVVVNDARKLVEIWLTRTETSNELDRNELTPIFAEYKARDYCVAVFESGKKDLFLSTLDLLLNNRIQKSPPQTQTSGLWLSTDH